MNEIDSEMFSESALAVGYGLRFCAKCKYRRHFDHPERPTSDECRAWPYRIRDYNAERIGHDLCERHNKSNSCRFYVSNRTTKLKRWVFHLLRDSRLRDWSPFDMWFCQWAKRGWGI